MDPDKLIVYVADDNEAVRKCMMRLLKTFNRVSKIKAASDGNELLNLVDAETPDVVILDVEMPVLNGIETAQRLHTRYPEVKILMLTMHSGGGHPQSEITSSHSWFSLQVRPTRPTRTHTVQYPLPLEGEAGGGVIDYPRITSQ